MLRKTGFRLFLVSLCLMPVAALAENCTFRIHSCVDLEDGRVEIDVFNGDDDVHLIPITEYNNAMAGVIAPVACARPACDTVIYLKSRPDGQPELEAWSHDECKDHSVVYKDGELRIMDRLGSCFGY